MKVYIFTLVSTLFLLQTACKKVPERGNAEKEFTLYFADRQIEISGEDNRTLKWVYYNACFDKVYGIGRPALSSCSNYSQGFNLPLNIDAPSSRFYLEKGNKRDSITIYYHTMHEAGGNEIEVVYFVDSIKTSFPRCTRECIKDIVPYCKDNEAYMSATVY